MAALESTRFVRFALPPSNPLFCNGNTFWPAKTSQSIPSLTNSQKARRPAATLSRSGCQAEAERHTAARAEGSEPVSAHSDDETDDDLPSLEELFRTPVPPSNISTKASKAERTLRHLEQPAPDATGTLIDQSKSELGERQGDSPDQPVILDDGELDEADTGDEAEGASGDVETGCLERDPSPYNTLATPELHPGSTESIDASGPWYDVEEGCYIDEPAPRLGSCEQQDMPSAPAQDQPQTLLQSFQPLQDQINQQDVGSITRSMSVESAPHSLLQMPNNDDSMAGLEKELELAFLEQVKLLSASALNSPRPFSVEASPDESQSREHTETTSISSEEMQDASRHGTPAQGLEEWEKRETEVVVEGGGVTMQQQQEFAAQKEELGPPVGEGDQQDVVDDDVADEPEIEFPPGSTAAPLKFPVIDEHRHISRASRSSSAPADTVLEDEPPTRKRGHQDAHTEISSDIHHSANIDDNHNACDTGDEDPRPAKRRKPRAALTVTSTTSQGHTPEFHVGQPGPLVALSTATPEIDDAQPQVDHECLSTFVDNSHQYASRIPQSPSVASEAVPIAEYREWPFQGFLKRTRIGDDMTYNLEFKLPSILEHIHLPIDPKGLDICSSEEAPAKVPTHHETAAHSNTCQTPLQPKKKRKHIKWTPEEDATLLQMRDDGSSWEYIFAALPGRNEGAIRMRYSTKLKKRSRTGPDLC